MKIKIIFFLFCLACGIFSAKVKIAPSEHEEIVVRENAIMLFNNSDDLECQGKSEILRIGTIGTEGNDFKGWAFGYGKGACPYFLYSITGNQITHIGGYTLDELRSIHKKHTEKR
jgi:hypothetical protein